MKQTKMLNYECVKQYSHNLRLHDVMNCEYFFSSLMH